MVVYTYSPSTWEIEARLKVQGHPVRAYLKNRNKKKKKKERNPPPHTPGWRDCLVKSFCRGLEFHSLHPHGDAQLSVTPGAGHLQTSAGMRHTCDLSEAWTRRMVPGCNSPWLVHD